MVTNGMWDNLIKKIIGLIEFCGIQQDKESHKSFMMSQISKSLIIDLWFPTLQFKLKKLIKKREIKLFAKFTP